MKVTLAKSAGFCFGVTRAVNEVYKQIEEGITPIYTYGPIIHNDEVIREMEAKGVRVIRDLEELKSLKKGTVIIRSHGISREEHETMEGAGFTVVDATCPFVLKIHRLVQEYSQKGYRIVIVGNPKHPEVCGIRGWVDGDDVCVVSNQEEAQKFTNFDKKSVCIVSQMQRSR